MVKFDTHRWCATLVFVLALLVYGLTMADSVSFWDCGEFTACSYTMGVPHPPGSPLFLLLGRVFSLLPLSHDIAVRVTWMSVLSSVFAILFAYLIIVRLIRLTRNDTEEKTTLDKVVTYGGGIIGALSLAWSYSMWFNAVESEVYAISQFFTHIVVWLILVWYEKADEPGNERWLLLIAYMIGLSTGVHLLMILVLPAIALLMYFRRRQFQMKTFIGMMAATGLAFFMIYPGVVKWLPLSASKLFLWAPAVIILAIVAIFAWAVKNRHGIIGAASAGLFLIVVGYSSYGMIYIRSNLNPGIDENDPDTPARFFSYLNREQYGDRPMFPRYWNNDPEYKSESDYFWRYQVQKMFNRYLFWQFIGREGAPHDEFQDAGVSPKYSIVSLFQYEPQGIVRWLAVFTSLPFILGLLGLGYQYTRDRRGWLVVAAVFFMTGYAIVLYLNQDNPQPRERDYSYVGAFFAFALWIGLGAAAVIEWIGKRLQDGPARRSGALAVAALLFLLSPVMLLARNYPMNDRSGNHVAWDYSYNMLMSCAPNGIVFTNGDNDTFPVWYMQEVEGIRRDVRIVNLSLLNTGWYIKQLKHREAKVPISFSDSYIDRYLDQHDAQALMARFWPPEKQKIELNTPEGRMAFTMPAAMFIPTKQGERTGANNFLRVQDMLILDILRTNYDPSKTRVPKPIYFAVTVANSNMIGLRDYLTFEGLVFRINPRGREAMDAAKVKENFFETFNGHFRGIDDPDVHFDDNVEKLLQNYRSGFLQLAYHYSTLPDTTTAKLPDESLDQLLANFDRLPNRQKALAVMLNMESLIPESVRPISSPELSVQLGRMYADLGRPEELRRRLEMASERETPRPETQVRLAAAWAAYLNDTARARQMLTQALGENPTGPQCYMAGRELFTSGAYSLAAEYFEKAFALDPNDGQTVGALLQCYENMGDSPRAAATLERWIARHPQDKAAQQRLNQLRGTPLTDTTTTPRSHQ